MSKTALFDINPDELFEKSSIHDIDIVHKKLQNEIERKREELRTMVGERYRELIQAADTITDMKVTSAAVIRHVGRISNTCEKTQENGFIKLQMAQVSKDKLRLHYSKNCVAVQIHLLINIPEKIWTYIENEDYLVATQLYLLARLISTGLQIHLSEGIEVINWKELYRNQWNVILLFKDNIKQSCYNALKSSQLHVETAVSCLCSLCLLDDMPLSQILDIFISIRLESFRQILHPHRDHSNVKIQVLNSANLLINTVSLVFDCFVGAKKPLISPKLEGIVGDNALPSIHILQSERLVAEKVLSDDILKFKPSMNVTNVSAENINKAMKRWLKEIDSYTNKELSELINLVSSVKSLQGIRQNVLSIEKPSEWKNICEELFIPDMIDIFGRYYQPLLTKRIEWLVQKTWVDALHTIKTDIKAIIKESGNPSDGVTSWKDCSHAVETCGKENLFTLVNLYSFSTNIIALCEKFDKHLKSLLDELHVYLYEDSVKINISHTNQYVDDTQHILHYLQQYSAKNIKELLLFIKMDCLTSQTPVILSRFLTALTCLCPNLHKCFYDVQPNDCKAEVYNEIKTLNLECWAKWIENMNGLLKESIEKFMPKEFTSRHLLTVFSQWDVIKIKEKDDQGQNIESIIKIPSHTSLPLQNVLNIINNRIIQIKPHTLPNVIRQELILNTANILLDYYDKLSQNQEVRSKQVSALQFYMDIKYLQLLMLQRDNKLSFEKFQRVAENLKSIIDPFDFDVFYPHLQNNIKRSVQKTQVQMGCIVSNPEQLVTILGTPNTTQDVPWIIPLINSQPDHGTNTYWFTLLPVTAPAGSANAAQNAVDRLQVKKVANDNPKYKREPVKSIKESTSANNSGLVRSGAAAFFGAMGQDWFGSH